MEFIRKYQKIIFAFGFLATVLLMGYLLYYFFFRPAIRGPETSETASTTESQTGKLPVAQVGTGQVAETTGAGGLSAGQTGAADQGAVPDKLASGGLTETEPLIDTPSLDPIVSQDGKGLQYYNESDGKFYKLDNNGNIIPMSERAFYDVEQVTWSPRKNSAVLEYPDGSNIIYNFDQDQQITIPAHWQGFSFSPSGDMIAAKSMGKDTNNRYLMTANSDGSRAKIIDEIGQNADLVDVSWSPNNQVIATYREGTGLDQQEIYLIGQNQENFKSMMIEGRGFEYIWSPDGKKILYSVYSTDTNLKPLLWVVNASGNDVGSGRKSLDIETWAEKCVFFDSTTAYCAVPEELPDGAGLMRELAESTKDDIYYLDLATGMKRLLAVPDGSYTIKNLMISENARYLYFNDSNGKIYKINL